MEDKDLRLLLVASALHDIGKFAQRAGRPFSRDMEGVYTTEYKGISGHRHSLYTDYFIERDLPLPAEMEELRSRIARVASAHHRPDSGDLLEQCVCIADRLSAGTDRIETEDRDDGQDYKTRRLMSIFEEVELRKHRFDPDQSRAYGLFPLRAADESAFPVDRQSLRGKEGDYKELFQGFLGDIQRIDTSLPFTLYLDALLSLLELYTWCIPSSTWKTLPDVSLFDHASSTAAIAQALYLYHRQTGGVPEQNDRENKFILCTGDLSGIQDYIFGISRSSGRGVSKLFRARSFFLQALTRAVVLSARRRLGLYSSCQIMDAGGKFILLVPALKEIGDRLEEMDTDLQSWCRRRFKGELSLVLSYDVQMKQADFRLERFQGKLEAVNASLERAKRMKLKRTFTTQGMVIHEGYDDREAGNCSLCGKNETDRNCSAAFAREERSELPICADCFDQIRYIGTDLPRTRFMIYGKEGRIELFDGIYLSLEQNPPRNVGHVLAVDALEDEMGFGRLRVARHLPVFNKEELDDPLWRRDLETDAGYAPEEGEPKTFGAIAAKSKKLHKGELIGRPLLGFVKADVDNLGLIFSLGLEKRLSIARFSFLARMLNFFFSDYLVERIRRDYPDIYVIFAGGDDLFLVGPWLDVVRFTLALRSRFRDFTAGNEDITLSAGIFVCRPRLPVRKAAEIVDCNKNALPTDTSLGAL
ncbi:MAG TPA: type III-A CRISPR-associated protein Cas10/Csm1 [Syntrophales bacterium]|nr:type III-A CRISPR-associated protein Cas10/Csm1 [Syntrophales bacterium]